MSSGEGNQADVRIEQAVGILLRVGVILSAAVVLVGGVLYFLEYGHEEAVNLKTFKGEPSDLRSPVGIVTDALTGDSRAIIQLGLLLLLATPIARVLFSVIAFARQGDSLYVGLTLVVLTLLLGSLFLNRWLTAAL
jgi:uncharacterized membrane protein